MSIAQTTQLLQLVLNSAVMMVIALAWWGIVAMRLSAVTDQMQRLRRQLRQGDGALRQGSLARLRQHRHELGVRYRLTRHSVLIMHYVLLVLMTSLLLLSLRALINANGLITVALFLFVMGCAGIVLSVALALMEFYQLNALEISPGRRSGKPPGPASVHSASTLALRYIKWKTGRDRS
ncbi:MAG: DUF2721 domain-containing protein [Leptolyngbyaceae cyanobacterium SM2_3_12]|nr:DUF2721 domain-containing protein [Leptolyngbyaceae cyanobacterium SM2_3_12]